MREPGARRRVRARRYLLLLLFLGLAVHLLLPQLTSLQHSLQVVRALAWWAVGLAAGAQLLSYVGSGYLVSRVVALFGHRLSIGRGILITMAATSLGLLWGGTVTYAGANFRWIRASGVSAEGALLTGWLPPVLNIFTLSLVSVFGLVYLLLAHELSAVLAAGFGLAVLLLGLIVGVALWGMRSRARLTRLLTGVAGRWARLRRRPYDPARTATTAHRLFSAWDLLRRGGWRGPVLGDVLNVGFDMLTLYCLFLAAGYGVSPGTLLAGYGLPLLLGKMAVLPGGVGIIEGSMAALYEVLGVPASVTVVVIIGYRLLSFWLPILLGFSMIPFLQGTGGAASTRFRLTEKNEA